VREITSRNTSREMKMTVRTTARRGFKAGAALMLAALTVAGTLTACSSSPSGSDGYETSEGPIPLVVARGQVNIENVILAQQERFFADNELDVTIKVGQGAEAQNSAIVSGEFDVGLTDAVSAIRAIAQGMPITIVAGTKNALPDLESEASDGLIVPPGSPI